MKTCCVAILVCVAGATIAPAQNTRKAVFVSPEQLDITRILPAPAASDSWQAAMELADLHRIQETRTPEQIAHARADDAEESMFAFQNVFGPRFNRENLPATALLSDHIKSNESIIVNPAKKFFARPRPYHFDSTLQPVCKTTENHADFGYPSGHGTTGYMEAMVLIQMIPEKRGEIWARADDYAYSREVCGAHYASDEAASKATAFAMMAIIMNNPQFKDELAAAKAETRRAVGLNPEPTPGSR
jgi:acid phosphatase (class A)